MSSRFSSALQLSELDDFITPSQECIKPIKIDKIASSTGSKIRIENDGSYVQLQQGGSAQQLQKVDISLSDCLACSGCITSAETVLVTAQSQEEMMRVFAENRILKQIGEDSAKLIVVSLSLQPILSLAVAYNLNPQQAAEKLAGYFKRLGADLVLDMGIADDFALLEMQQEFVERFYAKGNGSKQSLPVLSSSCPGWVCYAEKTHGSYILPYISSTKSPQQIMGSLVKDHLTHITNRLPSSLYHVTVMPCYDKKLEASRQDFYNVEHQTRDVDCVITAIELEQLMCKEGVDLADESDTILDWPWNEDSHHPLIAACIGSGSGGYAHHIFQYAANELFPDITPSLEFHAHRNQDLQEVTLEKEGNVLLRFAIVNGFRNIQNLVQKLKRQKCPYDFVEVMACPSGCLNGGAQIRAKEGVSSRELTGKLEKMFQTLPVRKPEDNKAVENLYNSWLSNRDSDKSKVILHTEYHAVEKNTNALNIKW